MSSKIREVWSTAWISLRNMTRRPLFYVICFLSLLFWYLFVWNFRCFAADTGYAVTPYILPHFFASSIYRMYGLLMLVLLTCDAPFWDEMRIYSLQRTGRRTWALGKILYIAGINVVYQLVMLVTLIVSLAPYIGFSGQWGSVLYTAANNPMAFMEYSGYGSVSGVILSAMGPLEALGKQMALCCLLGTVMGLLMLFLNGVFQKAAGGILLSGLILAADYCRMLDDVFHTSFSRMIHFNWMNLENEVNGTYSFGGTAGALLVCGVVLAAAVCLLADRRWFRITGRE